MFAPSVSACEIPKGLQTAVLGRMPIRAMTARYLDRGSMQTQGRSRQRQGLPPNVEPGETPREACEREVAEELGIHPRIGPLLVADWAPSQAEGDKILFIFDGGQMASPLTDQVVLPADELSEWRFHSEADLENALIPRLARRVLAALEAKRRTRTTYLEHGKHSVG